MNQPSRDPARQAEALAALLEEQRALYEEVRDLVRRQNACIAAADTDGLMSILAEKQNRIAAIDESAPRVEALRAECEAAGDALPKAARQATEAAVEALKAVLAEIVALEDEGQRAMGGARGQTQSKLKHLQTGKAMHKAYGAKPKIPPTSRFQDRNA